MDRLSTSESSAAHFAIAWEGVSWSSADMISFMVMQAAFGQLNGHDLLHGG